MNMFKIGDIVGRKSYNSDLYFKIVNTYERNGLSMAVLKGVSFRIEADSPFDDLELIGKDRALQEAVISESEFNKKAEIIQKTYDFSVQNKRGFSNKNRAQIKYGKILHIDGDPDYLKKCLEQYKKLGIFAEGRYVPEKEQPGIVGRLLQEICPDILVLTGHDGLIKGSGTGESLNNYKNSKYYIEATKVARRHENDLDSLIIFAGACQSMYGEIIKAGANFASSPKRILIHAFDPVLVSQQLASASFVRILEPNEVIEKTITGEKGIGGVQTRGKGREIYPFEQ